MNRSIQSRNIKTKTMLAPYTIKGNHESNCICDRLRQTRLQLILHCSIDAFTSVNTSMHALYNTGSRKKPIVGKSDDDREREKEIEFSFFLSRDRHE